VYQVINDLECDCYWCTHGPMLANEDKDMGVKEDFQESIERLYRMYDSANEYNPDQDR
jgi:hypothetical protein